MANAVDRVLVASRVLCDPLFAALSAKHVRKYAYDSTGHLDNVSDESHILYRFEYRRLMGGADNDPYLLSAVLDGDWNVLVRSKFVNGRVSEEQLGDGEIYRFEYQFKGSELIQTAVILPSGIKKAFSFENGILIGQL